MAIIPQGMADRLKLIFTDGTKESLIKHLPLLLVILSVASLLFAYVGEYSPFWGTFGTTVLSAGIFSSLLKVYQFKGIFHEDLEKIVYTERFMGSAGDATRAWKTVTHALYGKRFTHWNPDVLDEVIKNTLPDQAIQHNYRSMARDLTLSVTESPHILCFKDTTTFDYIPAIDNERPTYSFYFTTPAYQMEGKSFQETVKLIVDDQDISSLAIIGEPEDFVFNGENQLKFQCVLPLPSKEGDNPVYRIARSTLRYHNTQVDPFSRVFSDTFILRYSLAIRGLTKTNVDGKSRYSIGDTEITFIDAGLTGRFANTLPGGQVPADLNGDFFRHYDHLIFPGQGYILFYSSKEY